MTLSAGRLSWGAAAGQGLREAPVRGGFSLAPEAPLSHAWKFQLPPWKETSRPEKSIPLVILFTDSEQLRVTLLGFETRGAAATCLKPRQ